jgi:hypothetical protein
MKHIDEQRLEDDLEYRFAYLSEFMGFGQEDIDIIHGAAEALAPLVPGLVDAVYVQLFSYDCTKRHFVPRQSGYEGEIPTSLEELSLDHEQIKFRKQHLGNYLVKLVTAPYDANLVKYLDLVGKIHTPQSGSSQINVPLVQMNVLMGFVADAFHATIFSLGLDPDSTQKAIRAFSKLLWIQNDLIVRHYAAREAVSVA